MSSKTLALPTTATWPSMPACGTDREWHAATAVLEFVAQAEGPARDRYLEVLNLLLRSDNVLPKNLKLEVIHLIHFLDERREAEQLAAHPASRRGIERAAAHFAPKAQASLSPLPMPDEGDDTR